MSGLFFQVRRGNRVSQMPMKIKMTPVAQLVPYAANARTHSVFALYIFMLIMVISFISYIRK
jgi:hypothetical protein